MIKTDNIIAGPCSAESEDQVLKTASELASIGIKNFRAGVWKPRTMPGEFEGWGETALVWLKNAKETLGLKLFTEVATPHHVELALKYGVDVLWIGARTSGDPFALSEIANALHGTDVPVLVKNPSAQDLQLWIGAIERMKKVSNNVSAIHRGFKDCHEKKYRNAPLWEIPIDLKNHFGSDFKIYLDPSHLAGKAEFIKEVMQYGENLNFDGYMVESHCDPTHAITDAKQQVTPKMLEEIISQIIPMNIGGANETLTKIRNKIDVIDDEILALLARRQEYSNEVGNFKKKNNITVLQNNRYNEILARLIAQGNNNGLDEAFIKKIWGEIHQESIRKQNEIIK